MANKPNVTKLYDKIFSAKDSLAEIVQDLMEAANDAEAFGGEVSRVITGQIRTNVLPALQSLVDGEGNEGSMIALVAFLDSVPLAWVRQGPEQVDGMTPGSDIKMGALPGEEELAVPAQDPAMGVAGIAAESGIDLDTEADPVMAESGTLAQRLAARRLNEAKLSDELRFEEINTGYKGSEKPQLHIKESDDAVYENLANKRKSRPNRIKVNESRKPVQSLSDVYANMKRENEI